MAGIGPPEAGVYSLGDSPISVGIGNETFRPAVFFQLVTIDHEAVKMVSKSRILVAPRCDKFASCSSDSQILADSTRAIIVKLPLVGQARMYRANWVPGYGVPPSKEVVGWHIQSLPGEFSDRRVASIQKPAQSKKTENNRDAK
jgi:hypothetical protein